jgi:formate hydrogenlyase subunit 4
MGGSDRRLAGGVVNLAVAFGEQVAHVALMAAAAPTLIGVVRWMEARLAGRAGPSVLQPWRDLARLLRKQPVMAESASEIFALAPLLSSAAVAIVAVLVPSFTLGMTLAPFTDLLVIAGLLALARCSIALAGMDAGTALGGMGASRTMAFAVLSEPALILAIFALGLLAGSSNLDVIAAMQQESGIGWQTGAGLALIATVLVAIVDSPNGPAARLELAMRREAMTLEFSGRDLAVIDATEALRRLVWFDLIIAMFVPFGIAAAGAGAAALLLGLVCWVAKLLVLAGALTLLHTMMGRTRLMHATHMLGVAILLGLLAVVFLFASAGSV